MKKNEYLEHVGKTAKEIKEQIDVIYEYDRNRRGGRQGLVLAYYNPVDNNIHIGWSRCHDKKDKFNRNVAVVKAFNRALPIQFVTGYLLGKKMISTLYGQIIDSDVPHSIRRRLAHMVDRAKRYFKQSLPEAVPVEGEVLETENVPNEG